MKMAVVAWWSCAVLALTGFSITYGKPVLENGVLQTKSVAPTGHSGPQTANVVVNFNVVSHGNPQQCPPAGAANGAGSAIPPDNCIPAATGDITVADGTQIPGTQGNLPKVPATTTTDGRVPATTTDGRVPATTTDGRVPATTTDGRVPATTTDGRVPANQVGTPVTHPNGDVTVTDPSGSTGQVIASGGAGPGAAVQPVEPVGAKPAVEAATAVSQTTGAAIGAGNAASCCTEAAKAVKQANGALAAASNKLTGAAKQEVIDRAYREFLNQRGYRADAKANDLTAEHLLEWKKEMAGLPVADATVTNAGTTGAGTAAEDTPALTAVTKPNVAAEPRISTSNPAPLL